MKYSEKPILVSCDDAINHKNHKFCESQIWQIAEQLEYDSSKYYLESAELCDIPRLRRMCYELACWKVRHAKQYAKIKVQTNKEMNSPHLGMNNDYLDSHPRAMAGLVGLIDRQRRNWKPAKHYNEKKMLDVALARAKDTAAFYQGFKGFAADANSNKAIDRILNTQRHFISLLTRLEKHARKSDIATVQI